MAVDESEIVKTAEGLVARHGGNAISVAKDRVNALSKLCNQPELDTAFRVLSAVERLVGTEDSTGTWRRNEPPGTGPGGIDIKMGGQF